MRENEEWHKAKCSICGMKFECRNSGCQDYSSIRDCSCRKCYAKIPNNDSDVGCEYRDSREKEVVQFT